MSNTDTITPQLMRTWKNNTHRHINLHFAKGSDHRRHFSTQLEKIREDGGAPAAMALMELKQHVYISRNRIWLEKFLAVSFPEGHRYTHEERTFAHKVRRTNLSTPDFAFVIQSYRNELINLRTGDLLETRVDRLKAEHHTNKA